MAELSQQEPLLVADIGGTNARFALLEGAHGTPRQLEVYRCADFPTLEDAMEAYLARVGGRPRRAAIAVATPVTDDRVSMTNHVWAFSVAAARARLGLGELRVINDFTALALAVPRLGSEDLRQVGGGEPAADEPVALIGPGTGLGTSGLIPFGDRYVPLRSEGGHMTYGATTPRGGALLAAMTRRYGHVSVERLLSGPGLVNLYQAICEVDGHAPAPLTPADVTGRALAGACSICAEALETFCGVLGTVAGNLVLVLGARGGVYIGGGIVPQLGSYFEGSSFRACFEQRGRFSAYLAAVPSYVIHAEHPALLGAARALNYPPAEVGICSVAP